MALSATQQALLLFKKLMGKGSSNPSFDFFEESKDGKAAVYASQVWKESGLIPTTAPGSTTGVVQLFTDEALTVIPGTSNRAYFSANLIDAIPFNFGDGTSYNYAVKDSLGSAIPFGTGDWVVDPDTGTLTFYGTVPANMPPTITFYKYVGEKGVGDVQVPGNAGGGGSFVWRAYSNAPLEGNSSGVDFFDFAQAPDAQEIWAHIAIPSNYTAGTQITLQGGMFACSLTTGNVKFKATTYLVRPGSTVIGAFTNSHDSSNSQVAVGGTANQATSVGTIDLTSPTGQVNSVDVLPGDLLLVKLTRDTSSETSGAAADARLLRYSMTVDFGAASGSGGGGGGGGGSGTSGWDYVVGSSAQVSAGTATHSSLASAIAAAFSQSTILLITNVTESVTVNKELTIVGKGRGTGITGNLTVSASFCCLERFRVSGNVTLSAGADGNFLKRMFVSSTSVFTDNGTGNVTELMQE